MDLLLGELLWVELNNGSWWPAQVLDDKTCRGRSVSNEKFDGSVLMRLYGSYELLYVDPVRSYEEFNNFLDQNNAVPEEILRMSLEQELNRLKQMAVKSSIAKEKITSDGKKKKEERPTVKKQTRAAVKKAAIEDVQVPEESTGASAATPRRKRVMQGLGLAAPDGSPYTRRLNSTT